MAKALRASRVVWLLFFCSGASGLVYEVLWSRHLGLIFGNTVHSLAAVLSAFMAGLALGSWLAGRYLAGRGGLLKLYGLFEVAIGLYCAALPWLFEAVAPLYGSLYGQTGHAAVPVLRFAISFLLLLVPTTCMGATLPLLSQYMTRAPEGMARTAGALYAVNTFGAVAGASAAGFLLLPCLGRGATNLVAVVLNLLLGAVAVYLSRTGDAPDAPAAPEASEAPAPAEPAVALDAAAPSAAAIRMAALAFGVTGFAAMATQIAWTRALSLAIGSSTYAFSLIVSVFIFGLAAGGAWGSRRAPKLADPAASLARVLLGIGFLSMLVSIFLGWSPVLFFWLIAIGHAWGFPALMACEALGVALLLFLPTFLMGATLPLTLRIYQTRAGGAGGVGRTVGGLYAINTVGSILGSLLGGLVLLPLLRLQHTLQAGALLYTLPGLALLYYAPRGGSKRWAAGGVLAALTFLPVLTGALDWNELRMASGAYLLRDPAKVEAARAFRFADALPDPIGDEAVYYKEGTAATVAVLHVPAAGPFPEGLVLTVGGKPDASSHTDMATQVGLTLVPMLVHAGPPSEVLVIGMGSGGSLGAALAMEELQRADVVEISPEVMEASYHFAPYTGLRYTPSGETWVLDEPKVETILNDGRNHLRFTTRRYDVISSEPSNPWIAGIGNLFTREAFELCRARLKEGGVMCQWLHRYGMGEEAFRSVWRTFAEVFPHMQVWCVEPGMDFLLVGSDASLAISVEHWQQRIADPGIQEFLKKANYDRPAELLACLYADRASVLEVCGDAPLHTDDNLLLEFNAPRTLYQGRPPYPVAHWRVSPERSLDADSLSPARRRAFLEQLDLALAGRERYEVRMDLRSLEIPFHAAGDGRPPTLFEQPLGAVLEKAQEQARDDSEASLQKVAGLLRQMISVSPLELEIALSLAETERQLAIRSLARKAQPAVWEHLRCARRYAHVACHHPAAHKDPRPHEVLARVWSNLGEKDFAREAAAAAREAGGAGYELPADLKKLFE